MATQHETSHAPAAGSLVVSVSPKNPKVRTVRVARPHHDESSFMSATLKGLTITVKHFFKNVVARTDTQTIQYPEEKKPYPARSRGLHRLMQREDGSVRCVACMCCPTVCPANCITIIPAETGDKKVEKYPAVFEIDELRCVVCGLCVEACPCDAIRMDTGLHAPPVEERADGVIDKDTMLAMGTRSIAVQGGAGTDWRR
ncbi:MAG TPA: NADH-quinone oxidoreductase subunit I [Kofleriaceae bacterium]|nr:NADH-quinone oxidoreductase subunit I [Kofleriaceae bacterium]